MTTLATKTAEQYFIDHHDQIARYLGRRVDRNDVDGMVQETFLSVYARMSSSGFIPDEPLPYLYRVAQNVLRMRLRDKKMAQITEFTDDIESLATTPSAEICATSDEDFRILCEAIAELPEKTREAFILRKVFNYKMQEVADIQGVSLNTVKTYVIRAFKVIEERVGDRQTSDAS